MKTKLPKVLADYFAATNAHDVTTMMTAFAEGAVVKDEGRQHRGSNAIRDWIRETIDRYDFKVDPIEWAAVGGKAAVLVELRGNFPGSPVTLQYEFEVEGQKISRLVIGAT